MKVWAKDDSRATAQKKVQMGDKMHSWNRRSMLTGLGAASAASLWLPPGANALGLPTDKIKAVHYYRNSGDAAGLLTLTSENAALVETRRRSGGST